MMANVTHIVVVMANACDFSFSNFSYQRINTMKGCSTHGLISDDT